MPPTDPAPTAPAEPGASQPVDLLSLDEAALGALVEREGERRFRAKQLFAWLHQRRARSFDEMSDLPRAFRDRLATIAELRTLAVDEVRVATDGTRKYRLRTFDGRFVESVYIPNASGPGKNALCISSQVGCAMGCAFCATAALPLVRNLSAGEIVGQLYAVLRDLDEAAVPPSNQLVADDAEADLEREQDDAPVGAAPRRVQNVVYMGMGEPLHNVDAVLASIGLLTAPAGQGMSPRRITVSTSGIVPAVARLGAESDVHLAVSLNATTDEVRARIMPVDRRWPIAELLAALDAFPLAPRRRITIEYVLLAGVNDSDDDARRLVALVRGRRVKVNLIPFNTHPLSPFVRPAPERVEAFRALLDRGHVSCFVRSTRGLEIDAACGMLGGDKLSQARAQGGGGG
ncbi:MAG: 23S rRNA (adenine(2503)-C(2))-methyltransferase RlmN [Deltaproteobacteria bacterium]|nr:23S rRNA (adenine(2503)-C(2))-methyltransferase RlmN [Deltaproteobacteria bacterium]